jgi:triosephosphate isomerase
LYQGIELRPPIFEIGLKAYSYGAAAVALAREAEKAGAEHHVTVIFDPQAVDIAHVASQTERLLIFAQHMDSVTIGRGNGSVLAEALKEAGAHGTMLNHSERRIPMDEIERCVKRADEVGLATLICSDSPQEAAAVARFRPNIVLAEPPSLIGSTTSVGSAKSDFVRQTIELVGAVDPRIVVMCAAGVRTPEDVAAMVELGVSGTGCTSGILTAPDPVAQTWAMIAAMGEAWRKRGATR